MKLKTFIGEKGIVVDIETDLLKQVFRQEGQQTILGSTDSIVRITRSIGMLVARHGSFILVIRHDRSPPEKEGASVGREREKKERTNSGAFCTFEQQMRHLRLKKSPSCCLLVSVLCRMTSTGSVIAGPDKGTHKEDSRRCLQTSGREGGMALRPAWWAFGAGGAAAAGGGSVAMESALLRRPLFFHSTLTAAADGKRTWHVRHR